MTLQSLRCDRLMTALYLTAAAVTIADCTTLRVPAFGSREIAAADARAAWRRVLAQHVDAQGRVDFAAIAAAPRDLELYVAWLANAPLLEWPEEHLADLLNAYNALAMYNVVRSGIPESLAERKLAFFVRTRFVVSGRRLSLRALENDVIRPLGDPRVHFALNCMVRSCPRLPRRPLSTLAARACPARRTGGLHGRPATSPGDRASAALRTSGELSRGLRQETIGREEPEPASADSPAAGDAA